MKTNPDIAPLSAVDALYAESEDWHLNTGGQTIHAKRLPGRWRTIKWLLASVWLVYFLGPYLRWDGQQAVLFDIPNRKYHIFSATVLPQDFWMLSLLLLFFAILLAVMTALVGRVWCGFFCFQTVWTDVFTWIEERLEGPPAARRKLDQAPLTLAKARVKVTKHALWILIGFLTGFSFVAWFTDAPTLWSTFFIGQANSVAYATVALFAAGTYVLAGFLREQTCFWLCPYARIQGVMLDKTTIVPTYDEKRGEPRGRVRRDEATAERANGDCVDCNQCVAVCPTGIDIRRGQQEGCITCALCLDACDQVMDKVGRPRGLIRYASLDELEGLPTKTLLLRPRVWVYSAILALALGGIVYGLTSLAPMELKVLHERAPLFVLQSDGSIQNKYTLKILNKTPDILSVTIRVSGHDQIRLAGAEEPIETAPGGVTPAVVFVRIPRRLLAAEQQPIVFRVEAERSSGDPVATERESVFIGPPK
ncbi:cytochrome c oxidase accessory protein CcoG [Thiocystis violacea]|uniref:cytochrome c oxidase accessory protein CcoG n=1 Tax=Thiocystis violacea TaxID=13725 RepID=UPI001908A4FA|nr:cytochrome c oxidase accessory protein CcoG [Thiocystis violacea]MBK1718480.1 cytochrome c oxidase accessory protein CcoG [Thiocystis violacea]